jgi:hypothetical protein
MSQSSHVAFRFNQRRKRMDAKVPYWYGQDAVSLQWGWFAYKETLLGKDAETPIFEEWAQLVRHMGQEGYVFARNEDRMFVRVDVPQTPCEVVQVE